MHALIADDDNVTAMVLAAALRRLDFRVTLAHDGNAAWQRIQQERPSLAIVDWMMPGVDGLELCRRIRQAPEHARMYVVLLTARDGRGDVVEGLQAGADDYLVKPFDVEELRARIRSGVRILALQNELTRQIEVLRETLANVKQLKGLLPICAYCKKIRNDEDYWQQLEGYISDHSDAQFSHGICPGCLHRVENELGTAS